MLPKYTRRAYQRSYACVAILGLWTIILQSNSLLIGKGSSTDQAANYLPKIVNVLICYSLNFSSSLVTKLWTPIYDSAMWKIPVFPADTVHFYNSQSMLSIDGLVEPNLATVFHHLQYTTLLFNKHYYQKTKVNGIFIHQCLGFVHSGLIAFEGRLSKFSECLRLAMMVFLATTFRLPGLCQKTYCGDLPHKLQISYASAKASNPFLPKKIKLWITFLLLISTDKIREQHIYETCIYEAWKVTAARGLGWDETRRHLKQAMWIDSFHDDLGKGTFEVLKELRSAS